MQIKLLVTGPIFSGKTWLSEVLFRVSKFHYIHEVLNPISQPGIRHSESTKSMFPVIRPKTPGSRELHEKIYGESFFRSIRFSKSKIKDELSIIKSFIYRFVAFKLFDRICIKDPFSIFSSEVYISELGFQVLFLTRLPVGFLSTLEHFDVSLPNTFFPPEATSNKVLENLRSVGFTDRSITNLHYWILVNEHICETASKHPQATKIIILDMAKQKNESALVSEISSFFAGKIGEDMKKIPFSKNFTMPAESALVWDNDMNSCYFTKEQSLAIEMMCKPICERLKDLL